MKPKTTMKLALLAATASAVDMSEMLKQIDHAGALHKKGFLTDTEFARIKNRLNSEMMGEPEAQTAPRRRLSDDKDKIAKSKCLASQVDRAVKASDECMDAMTKSVAPTVTGIVQYLTKNGGGGGGGGLGEKAFDALFCTEKQQNDSEKKDKTKDDEEEDNGKQSSKIGGCVLNRLKEVEEEYVSKQDFLTVLKHLNLKMEDGKLITDAPSGLTQQTAAASCSHIYKYFKKFASGTYWVKKGGSGAPVKAYCDMGDKALQDIGGWTLVYKSGSDGKRWDNGLNTNEFQIQNMASMATNVSGKFSDADINKWLNMSTDKTIRYVGEVNANLWNLQYTQKKEFCNNNSPSCSKASCAKGQYPHISVRENPNEKKAIGWKRGFKNQGGVYSGHNNLGNCHGAMNKCTDGWINNSTGGHICTWNAGNHAGIWFNYGPYSVGRFRGHFWVLAMDVKELK